MGLFDFLKAKKKKEIKTEKVTVDELEKWISSKKEQIKKEELLFLKTIENRVLQLIKEFEDEIIILEKKDLREKKIDVKSMVIVKENLNNYILRMKELIVSLKSLRKDNIDIVLGRINFAIFSFWKNSGLNYEKATFLIGKELADTKNSLIRFCSDFEKITKENSGVIEKAKLIGFVENEVLEIRKIRKLKLENENKKQEMSRQLEDLENKKKKIEGDIKRIGMTKEYLEKTRKKDEIKSRLDEIDKEKHELHGVIDYELLAKNFHSDRKKMDIIKKCRDDYKEIFHEENWEKIISFLNGAKIENNNLSEKINSIIEKQKAISNTITEKDEIYELNLETERIISKIRETGNENSEIIKRDNKFYKENDKIINLIRKNLEKMGAELQ